MPPVIAGLTVTWIYVDDPGSVGAGWYAAMLGFLTLIPLSAYPLARVLTCIRERGRAGERSLAFVMGLIGYFLGTSVSMLLQAPVKVSAIMISYLASATVLAAVNRFAGIKASGHACGVAGPMTLLTWFLGVRGLCLLLVLPAVFWARVASGHHSMRELVLGAMVGVVSTWTTLAICAAVVFSSKAGFMLNGYLPM
ncbi:MAG TPA: hypothetical protein GXX51_07950 [Firmicutes bacterium]|nr:hypothetical protein [Bacillota bacterium]